MMMGKTKEKAAGGRLRDVNPELLQMLDKITAAAPEAEITMESLVRMACLSALIGCGMTDAAEDLLSGSGKIGIGDAMAAMGLLIIENLSSVGPAGQAEIKLIGSGI